MVSLWYFCSSTLADTLRTNLKSLQCHYADSLVLQSLKFTDLSWITFRWKWRLNKKEKKKMKKLGCISCINVQIWDNCTDTRFPTFKGWTLTCHVFSGSYCIIFIWGLMLYFGESKRFLCGCCKWMHWAVSFKSINNFINIWNHKS